MRQLVDGWCIGVAGVMPYAKCEVAEREALAAADEAEDHSELAIRSRQIDLEAGWELRAVAALGIAAPQRLDLDPVLLELAASLPQLSAPARPLRIVSSAKAPSLKRTRA